MYRFRFDHEKGLNVNAVNEVTSATTSVLVHHVLPHGNPHYHAYIETELKENTLRQRIKRLGLTASDFSLKKCDPNRKDEYIQYLFNQKHDNIPTLISTLNYDSEHLHKLQIQAQSIASEYANRQNSERNSKPTVYELAKEIHQKFSLKYRIAENYLEAIQITNNVEHIPTGKYAYEEFLRIAIKTCHKYNQAFEENYLRRLVTTSMSLYREGQETIINKIMDKEFRTY